MKNKLLLSAVCFCLLCPQYANAQRKVVAGTRLDGSELNPHAGVEMTKNIADVFSPKVSDENTDTFFSADEIESDEQLGTIVAKGNVNLQRQNVTLVADKIVYNQKEDVVTAVGNVVILEESGNVVFSDYSELSNRMSEAEMRNLKVLLKDKTRMSASSAKKDADDNKVLENATYTPCDTCKSSAPLWSLRATEVKHDAKAQDVYYKHAFLDIKGVPVFYMPFFTHPDPTVKKRSGFLPPTIKTTSYLGPAFQARYFFDISDNDSFVFSPIISSKKGGVLAGNYTKYMYDGNFDITGNVLKDTDTNKWRGNLFATARQEVNDYWLADANLNYVSDRSFLKDLSLPKKNDTWLTSSVALQGFDDRNYANLSAYYYYMLSNNLKDYDKPLVLPFFEYENYGDLQPFGAFMKTNISAASVLHEEDSDAQRISMINSWILPYTSPYGEKYKLSASVKSDVYYVDDYVGEENKKFEGAVARVFPQLGLEWRMPFIKVGETTRHILEPVLVGVLAPNGGNKANKIPNDDSLGMLLDDTNVLSLDRFSGYDRNDTGSRISYGFNWNSYGTKYGHTSVFIAQSYEFNGGDEFKINNDVNSRWSDYVGRAYLAPNDSFALDYRFRADKDDLSINYSELGTFFGPDMLRFYVSYIYLAQNNNLSFVDGLERNELYTSLSAKVSKDWTLTLFNRQDLAEQKSSLEHGGELIYEDECLKLINYIKRTNSTDPEDDNDFEFGVTFFLKTLGGAGAK